MPREHIHFVTGRLAEPALRATAEDLAARLDFSFTVDVLPITVAALMTTTWVAARMQAPAEATRVILPGYCLGDLASVQEKTSAPVERGPRDLRRLPEYFGRSPANEDDYGAYDIEIIAEINHAPRLTLDEILRLAAKSAVDGADAIDVGCEPGDAWPGVYDCVRALRDAGRRVSIDSMNPREIADAARAGAELVLSVNGTNRNAAADWGCEVVAIPDDPRTLAGLDATVERLAAKNVPFRLDPIVEPIGCGFAASLGRYLEVRRRYPQSPMMMGIGNLTELTDADSAGVNVLLLGFCQELSIGSVLTTEVIPWAQSSVRECDLARRLVHYAVNKGLPPKRVEPRLVMLRDPRTFEHGDERLDELAARIKDHNYRLFAERGQAHVVAAGLHLADADPFRLFEQLLATGAKNLDPAHAFYLGYELCKAVTALTLGKDYRQDEALDWGFLTRREESHWGKGE
jgi:dihydropteroate synthase-like protein